MQASKVVNEQHEKSFTVSQIVTENPFKVLSIGALCWGSLLLFLFFNRIGYLPDVNIESVTSVLYALSLLGLAVSLYTMLVMVLPGLFLAHAKTVTEGVSLGHLICISMGAAIIWAIWLFRLLDVQLFSWHISKIFAVTFSVLIVVAAPFLGLKVGERWPSKCSEVTDKSTLQNKKWATLDNKPRIYLWSLGSLFALLFLLFISVLFIGILGLGGSIRTATGLQAAVQITMLMFLIAFASALIAGAKQTDTTRLALIFAPSVLFLVLSVTGSFSVIPMIAVKSLQLGEISAARITISGKVCNEINQALGQRVCISGEADEATAICPVSIKSRIGAEVVLEFSRLADIVDDKKVHHVDWVTTQGRIEGNTGRRISRRIIIDKSKLLSWQPLIGIDEADIESLKDAYITPHVASWLDYTQIATDPKSPPLNKNIESLINERCGELIAPEKSVNTDIKASQSLSSEK